MIAPLLTISGLEAGYGQSQVLFGLELAVGSGEVVSLLGRNGVGKTTMVRAVMGLLPLRGGSICLDGRELAGRVEATFLRGRQIYESGRLLAEPGTGTWLARPER